MPTRIAMWSGPRNISTALMRSWEARGDTAVCDEPFYAHYLAATGRNHPGREEILAHHDSEWRSVIDFLTGPVPGGRAIFYQKHMAHHLLDGISPEFVETLDNCLLIRDPEEMLASLAKVIPDPGVEETGLPQQVMIFERLQARDGIAPPVIDSRDLLRDPPGLLRRLCDRLGVPYTDRMLTWTPGPRSTDGIWARHWYAGVEMSSGFEPYRRKDETVPAHLRDRLERCRGLYERLSAHRLR